MVVFQYEWKRNRKYILTWALSLAACIFIMTPVYNSMVGTADALPAGLKNHGILVSVGMSVEMLQTPFGMFAFLTSFFKIAANLCNLLILTVICGLCNYFTAVAPLGGLGQKSAIFTTTAGLFLTEVILYALSLGISGLAASYKRAVQLGAAMLIVFYCIYFAAELLKNPVLYFLTPIKYFDVCVVSVEGISIIFLLLGGVITTAAIAIAVRKWSVKEL